MVFEEDSLFPIGEISVRKSVHTCCKCASYTPLDDERVNTPRGAHSGTKTPSSPDIPRLKRSPKKDNLYLWGQENGVVDESDCRESVNCSSTTVLSRKDTSSETTISTHRSSCKPSFLSSLCSKGSCKVSKQKPTALSSSSSQSVKEINPRHKSTSVSTPKSPAPAKPPRSTLKRSHYVDDLFTWGKLLGVEEEATDGGPRVETKRTHLREARKDSWRNDTYRWGLEPIEEVQEPADYSLTTSTDMPVKANVVSTAEKDMMAQHANFYIPESFSGQRPHSWQDISSLVIGVVKRSQGYFF